MALVYHGIGIASDAHGRAGFVKTIVDVHDHQTIRSDEGRDFDVRVDVLLLHGRGAGGASDVSPVGLKTGDVGNAGSDDERARNGVGSLNARSGNDGDGAVRRQGLDGGLEGSAIFGEIAEPTGQAAGEVGDGGK